MGNEYVHMVMNLLAVVLLMLVLAYFLKKLNLSKLASNKHIKIISSTALSHKEKVVLLEVNNTTLLIGVAPGHLETLYVFDELATPREDEKKFSEQMNTLSRGSS